MGLGSVTAERGGSRGKGGRKRVLKTLEEWPPDPGSVARNSGKRKQVKRLQGTDLRKGSKEASNGGRGQVAMLKQWLETGKGGLGPRKESEDEN